MAGEAINGNRVINGSEAINGNRVINGSEIEILHHKIHSLVQRNINLSRMVYRNPLTGLPLRPLFARRLTKMLNGEGNNGHSESDMSLVVMVVRLKDNYNKIRDTRNRSGAVLIKSIVRIQKVIGSSIYQSDRMDEFLMCFYFPNAKGQMSSLEKLLSRLVEVVCRRHDPPADGIIVSCNVGVAIKKSGDSRHTMMENAFIALEESIRIQLPFMIYVQSLGDGYRYRRFIDRQLFESMHRGFGGFRFLLQPIVCVDGAITGAEVLLRWADKTGHDVAPDMFIPLAEKSGYVSHIDQWVLFNSIRMLGQSLRQLKRQVFLSINLSPGQFNSSDLPLRLNAALEYSGVPGNLVKLEITERIAMSNPNISIETMKKLRNLGANIAIDDFGTGYSSLNYLSKFPVSTLKIDRSFVHNIDTNEDNQKIVKIILSLAKNFDMDVIVEGIENRRQAELLQSIGCKYMQGFYFSKPLEVEDFWQLVNSNAEITSDV